MFISIPFLIKHGLFILSAGFLSFFWQSVLSVSKKYWILDGKYPHLLDSIGNLKINASDSIVISVDQSGNFNFTPPTNLQGDIDFYYTISDGKGGEIEASQAISVRTTDPDPIPNLSLIENLGKISLMTDGDDYYASQDLANPTTDINAVQISWSNSISRQWNQ